MSIDDVVGRANAELLTHTGAAYGALFVIATAIRATYWQMSGDKIVPSSETFLSLCEPLPADFSGFFAILSDFGPYWTLFSGYWVPMCGVYKVAGGSVTAVVLWQIFLSAATCVLIFDLGRRYFTPLAGLIAGLFMAGMLDNFAWTTRLLSDVMFTFLITLSLWQLHRYRTHRSRANQFILAGILLWLALTKPQGLPVVVVWLTFDLLPRRYDLGYDIIPYRRVSALLAGVLMVPLLAITIPWGLEQGIKSWRDGLLVQFDPTFTYEYVPRAATGAVEFLLVNIDYMIIMAALKTILFYLPVVGRFSLLHNAINMVTLLPVTLFGFAGFVKLIRNRKHVARDLGVPVIVLTAIVAATFIDYSWGYRPPVIPSLALATGYLLTENRWLSTRS
ncbi:glycosyltransferase family 39 protein [Halosimplex rubrum]|uniref:Glycosyltransferase family 39 protein n=1 Tax=Halosimplex rubrum TaxID=869889 RepID=A0A7D5T5F9_9EURY|nr:glycosyltransferase family 39 protein [Halosimplex rubrum]QLH76855.1 glycosyltransferase family 39 protein [Halosimplex rubrum]